MDSLYLGAYWGDRVEDLGDCSLRLRDYIRAIGGASEPLKNWISRRKSPVLEFGPQSSRSDVSALLSAGVNRKDFGGGAIPQLGFSAGLWNGRTRHGEAASLTVTCGLAAGSPNLVNSCVLRFPVDLRYGDNATMIRSTLEAAIQCWEPDWAWVGSDGIRDAQGGQPPLIGPLSFLSGSCYTIDRKVASVPGVDIEYLQSGALLAIDLQMLESALSQLKILIYRQ